MFRFRIILWLTVFIFSINGEAQTIKEKYNSLLWEITGNGLKKPSYLYGTMHVSSKLAFHLTDTFFIGLQNAEVIALEQDPGNWLSDMMESGMLNATFNALKNKGNFYKSAFQLTVPDNRMIKRLLKMTDNNGLINGLLYRFDGASDNFEENTYLDLFIYQSAKKMGKMVTGLENFRSAFEMVGRAQIRSSDDEDDNAISLGDRPDRLSELIEEAYRRGDLDALDSLQRFTNNSKQYRKWMLGDRNIIMANGMDSIMKAHSLFTGVGAAHLPGDDGVITLLRQKGYHVRAVEFVQSGKSDKMKEKIESSFRVLDASTVYSADSVFSVKMPGKLFEIANFNSVRQLLYPDMVNGAYYYISRIAYYSPFSQLSSEQMQIKIDSLLFENVPGKILSRKNITVDGYNATDITNQTRRGNLERIRIVYTPLEVLVFKLSGTGKFAERSEISEFFNSITFTKSKQQQWKKFIPPNNAYEVSMPGLILQDESLAAKGINEHDEFIHSFNERDSTYFLLIRSAIHDYNYLEEDSFEVRYSAEVFADGFEYKRINGFVTDRQSKTAYRYTAFKGENKMHVLTIVNGPFYYLLACNSKDSAIAEKYFSSFQFRQMKPVETFETYTDTTLGFSTKSIVDDQVDLESLMRLTKRSERRKRNKRFRFLDAANFSSKEFICRSTNEQLKVSYILYSDFYQAKSKEEFWEYISNDLSFDSSYVLTIKNKIENDSTLQFDFIESDTACSRGIFGKYILSHNSSWKISTIADMNDGPGIYFKTFTEHFSPVDTIVEKNIFSHKAKGYFEDIRSSDSTLFVQAKSASRFIKFNDEDAQDIIELIQLKNDSISSTEIKFILMGKICELKSDKVLPFFAKYYEQMSDSSHYQSKILECIARCKTIASTQKFLQLVSNETPLNTDDDFVVDIFEPFFDSTQLAAKLFPQLLDLTRYPEYKEKIIALLRKCVKDKTVTKEAYVSQKNYFLREGNDELKRLNASAEQDNKNKKNNFDFDSSLDNYTVSHSYVSNSEGTSKNSVLRNYIEVLIPFRDDAMVNQFFAKVLKSKNKDVQTDAIITFVKYDVAIADSSCSHLSDDIDYRWKFYDALKKARKEYLFDSTYLNQQQYVTDYLRSKKFSDDGDSIIYLDKRLVQYRDTSGYVYFFKSKKNKMKKWEVNYIYFQPEDTMAINNKDVDQSSLRKKSYDEKRFEEDVNGICKRLSLTGRRRASTDASDAYSFADEDFE